LARAIPARAVRRRNAVRRAARIHSDVSRGRRPAVVEIQQVFPAPEQPSSGTRFERRARIGVRAIQQRDVITLTERDSDAASRRRHVRQAPRRDGGDHPESERALGHRVRPDASEFTVLRAAACRANVELARRGLARFTFGNASAVDRELGVVAIKPSGVPYDDLTPESMVVVELAGKIVDGNLHPSSDLATHLELYRAFDGIGGVVHTHSHYATVWAQAQREIPCFGTTHADYFHGPVPVTTHLESLEITQDYEANTGRAIVRRFERDTLDPLRMPA